MIIRSILGHYVYLDSRQEAALALAERIHQEREKEKQEEEERALQRHLQMMERPPRIYPLVEAWKKNAEEKISTHRHAWEYTHFTFFHEGKEYYYSNGEILNPPKTFEEILGDIIL